MRGVRLLVMVVVLRCFAKDFCKARNVNGLCVQLLPFAAGKPRLNFLEQPAVSIGIFERSKREVGTTLWIATSYAWVFSGAVEWTADVLEYFADFCAASDQIVAGGLDVIDGQRETLHRARFRRQHSFTKNDRGEVVMRRELNDAEIVALFEIGIEPPPELLIKCLR